MGHLFWLSDAQWAVIGPLLPNNKGGARRVDDRLVISGIIHVLKVGRRWCDCLADYGPSITIHNRFKRWSHKRSWVDLVETLATSDALTKSMAIGRLRSGQTTRALVLTDVIGHPFAFKLTGGNAADSPIAPVLLNSLKGARYLLADEGYDANSLQKHLRQSAIVPVISGRQGAQTARGRQRLVTFFAQ